MLDLLPGTARQSTDRLQPKTNITRITIRFPSSARETIPNAAGRPIGGLLRLVESGGLEPSTFRV